MNEHHGQTDGTQKIFDF